jgi:hypothetical protein
VTKSVYPKILAVLLRQSELNDVRSDRGDSMLRILDDDVLILGMNGGDVIRGRGPCRCGDYRIDAEECGESLIGVNEICLQIPVSRSNATGDFEGVGKACFTLPDSLAGHLP